MRNINKPVFYLFLLQLCYHCIFALSSHIDLPECEACLQDGDKCFNETLSNTLTIKSRGVEYIELDLNHDNVDSSKVKRGTVLEVTYIIASPDSDTITVQLENGSKDQYIIESRDNRVGCSYRKSLRFYNQNEKIAVYCNNLYYDCEVKYEVIVSEPQKERNEMEMPGCNECSGRKDAKIKNCFESIYLPVHSWYYLYFDGHDDGMYLDFVVSSQKKDSMRVEVQSGDGLYYLFKSRRDKVRCSDPQKSVPVRWKSSRIAVYCYNNYIGCKFSVFARTFPMDKTTQSKSIENIKAFNELNNPKWSEWSEWSDCLEYHSGLGRRTRHRKCLNVAIDFVNPGSLNEISSEKMDELIKSSNYTFCEGPSVEIENCKLEVVDRPLGNLVILFFIISGVILIIFIKPKSSPKSIRNKNKDNKKNREKLNKNSPYLSRVQSEISASENSPLINTYFRRYD